jgi:histidine triad (HIT) family protein
MHQDDCIFCKISRHEIPASIVAESATLVAFHDVNPMAPTHILVVPKEHVASVNDLDGTHASLVGDMVLMAKDLAKEQGVDVDGFRLVLNTGPQAGQSVFHIHMHLLGGRVMGWPPG